MNVGIVSGCDPHALSEYLSLDASNDKCAFSNAPSVTTYVLGLLRQGHYVRIFSTHKHGPKNVCFHGSNIDFFSVRRKREISSPVFGLFQVSKSLKNVISNNKNGLDVLHAQWTYEYAYACLSFANQMPVFCTVRDWLPYICSTISGTFRRTKLLWIAKSILWKRVITDKNIHFIANSDYTKSMLQTKFNSDIPVIYNPIDSRFIIKHRDTYPDVPTYISISVNLSERKNYDTLMRAFALVLKQIPNAKLILCGEPFNENNHKVQEWYKKGLMTNVELVGKVVHDDIFKYFDMSTILVHPSLEETFGNTLIEAMARKVLCVGGKNSGAVPIVLGYGQCGILCDVKDPKDLCDSMVSAYEDKRHFTTIANEGTKKLLNTYDVSIIVKKHIDLYRTKLN